MTFTISRQAHWQLFQETVERSQHPDPDDAMDVVRTYATGIARTMES